MAATEIRTSVGLALTPQHVEIIQETRAWRVADAPGLPLCEAMCAIHDLVTRSRRTPPDRLAPLARDSRLSGNRRPQALRTTGRPGPRRRDGPASAPSKPPSRKRDSGARSRPLEKSPVRSSWRR